MDSNQCKSRDDIYLYLVSNFQYIFENINVGDYKQILGFRQKMVCSQVWYNDKTKKWAFHVSDDEFTGLANMGEYNSFIELLNNIVDKYVHIWYN